MNAPATPPSLNHFDAHGQAHMVDVGHKAVTDRRAVAQGCIQMQSATLALIQSGQTAKGDVLGVARLAGIMAAKKTADLIPLCHPLALTHVSIDFDLQYPISDSDKVSTHSHLQSDAPQPHHPPLHAAQQAVVWVRATVATTGQTGVEMEALTAASVALLTIYDMCKAVDKGMTMHHLGLLRKTGGKSGDWALDAA